MPWQRPEPTEFWRAVDIYLAIAYDGPPPGAVEKRLAKLRSTADAAFYGCDVFERSGDAYALRLGNRHYPHMKLVVAASPSGQALFRADTHDQHVVTLVGPGDPALEALVEQNKSIASAIEDTWAMRGLPTAITYWRDALVRRRSGRA